MNLTPQNIYQAALQLAEEERLQLAMDLLDSLPGDELPEDETLLSMDDPELIAKLEQRGADEQGAMSWEQLRDEIK